MNPRKAQLLAAHLSGMIGRTVCALTIAIVGGVALVALAPVVSNPVDPGAAPWWLIGVGFFLSEGFVLLARGRVSVVALSPHAATLGVALFLLDPGSLLVAQVAGMAVALVIAGIGMRSGLIRLAVAATSTAAALALFMAVGSVTELSGLIGWVAAVVAVTVATAVDIMLPRLWQPDIESTETEIVPHVTRLSLLGAIASACIALVALELIRLDRPGQMLLLLLPFASCAAAVWATTSEHRRLVNLRLLADAVRRAHEAPGRDASILELLEAPLTLVDADVAWIALLPRTGGDELHVASTAPEGTSPLRACRLQRDRAAGVHAEIERDGAREVSGDDTGDMLYTLISDLGLKRAISIPLCGEDGVNGLLIVGSRSRSTPGYRAEDLRLLETFAGNASVLVENDRLERSVTELQVLKDELRHQAYHDTLTALPNRALFSESVTDALDVNRSATPAVLFLDLDDFKTINDSLGHHAGDELLVAVAGRVRGAVRIEDLPARLGGDEFAVLARDGGKESAELIADRLVRALEAPFMIAGREMRVHASVGIAYGKPGVTSADELLRNADVAMYNAKHSGKGRHATYEPEMHLRVRHRQELVSALTLAAERNEIGVHYQPIVDLASGKMVAVEALARWDRPSHGLLLPGTFIPVAEETGLMLQIGRNVLREACSRVASWQRTFPGMENLRVNVNLAPSEITGRQLVENVVAILEETSLPADTLVLEITESGVMENPDEALATMNELRSLGISLALDDFGTGHSSLAHLRMFPIDTLKIAREFVAGLPESPVDTAFFETIVRLGGSLGLDVVAEGIECAAQASAVTSLGCGLAQGFHFGHPLAPLGLTYALNSSRHVEPTLRVA